MRTPCDASHGVAWSPSACISGHINVARNKIFFLGGGGGGCHTMQFVAHNAAKEELDSTSATVYLLRQRFKKRCITYPGILAAYTRQIKVSKLVLANSNWRV